MTAGYGAKLTPEQGCVSSIKCLFGHVTSGYYYGSDGLRSPVTMTRDPGMPEYQGEDDPQHAVYNKT
jgi:carbonyl reductase 1